MSKAEDILNDVFGKTDYIKCKCKCCENYFDSSIEYNAPFWKNNGICYKCQTNKFHEKPLTKEILETIARYSAKIPDFDIFMHYPYLSKEQVQQVEERVKQLKQDEQFNKELNTELNYQKQAKKLLTESNIHTNELVFLVKNILQYIDTKIDNLSLKERVYG